MRPAEALTEQEFNELQEYLHSDDSPEACMDISMLDGFFAALAIRPSMLRPNIWLPEVLGSGEEGGFHSGVQAAQILSLLLRYYNDVVWYLREAADEFAPVFYSHDVGGEKHQLVDAWCLGFIRGLKLENTRWREWLEDPELRKFLGPFLLLATPASWGKLELSGREDVLRAELVGLLQPSLVALGHKWRSEEPATPAPRASTRAGRNDLCPCGSGKKYKKCCGMN